MIKKIIDLYENSFRGDPMAWHASSTMQLLKDTTAEQAQKDLIKGIHSIWELVDHLTFYEKIVIKTLEGATFPIFMNGEEWPPRDDYSEEAWNESLHQLEVVHDKLVDAIKGLHQKTLGESVKMDSMWPEPWLSTTYYELLHGMLHHKIYHTAQIAVLQKQQHNR